MHDLFQVAEDGVRVGYHGRKAMTEELALAAAGVIRRSWQRGRIEECSHLDDDLEREVAELVVDGDLLPATGSSEPDGPNPNLLASHLLEAQCLGGDLDVGCPTVTSPDLVLDRDQGVSDDLDGVGAAGQAKRF